LQGVNDVLDVDGISTVQIDNWLQVSASESLLFLFHICALAQWSVGMVSSGIAWAWVRQTDRWMPLFMNRL